MNPTVNKDPLRGRIALPGSKSIAARSLVCRLLSGHDTVLTNLPDCGDTRGMLRLTEAVREALQTGRPVVTDIGEGGTTLRFGMAACASVPGLDITLTGSPRLMQRPHSALISALEGAGANISFSAGGDAIHIIGTEPEGGRIDLDGSVSSQFISALMLAAPTWHRDTVIRMKHPVVSAPYIRMTAGVMRSFGANVEEVTLDEGMEVRVAATGYAQCARYDVEGDWSGASYFFETRLIMEALGMEVPEMTMPTLKSPAESLQGDSRVAAIFADATARLRSGDRSSIILDLNEAPDLVPAVAVGLCIAGLPFRIDGVAHLRHKESDRMAAISTELARLGYSLSAGGDFMEWTGLRCEPEKDPHIMTYLDHRMAMAFAPARLAFPSLSIENPAVVDKSFPCFWQEFDKFIQS